MTGQEIGDLLIEVTTWAGLTVLYFIDTPHRVISPVSSNIQVLLYFIDTNRNYSAILATLQITSYALGV
jgi:hypothetical protein